MSIDFAHLRGIGVSHGRYAVHVLSKPGEPSGSEVLAKKPTPAKMQNGAQLDGAAVPPPPKPPSTSYCMRFQLGKCDRGGRCRYIHDESLRPKSESTSKSSLTATGKAPAVRAEEPEDGRNKAWRAIDFLLMGNSVQTHPYLKDFAAAPWLDDLRQQPGARSLLNKRSLRKEISESFGVLYAAHRALAKLGPRQNAGRAVIIDACCGKGLGSLIMAKSMPDSLIYALDRDPRMDMGHLQEQANVSFVQVDMNTQRAHDIFAEAAAEAKRRKSPLVVIGVHLCGALSPRVAELYHSVDCPAALVLVPCCLDRKDPRAKLAARGLGITPYSYWCMSLLWSMPVSSTCRRELLIDDNVLSERNTFILAARAAAAC
eukprot:TRINITY_DN10019_c0_g1_i1.p1 TRINITY_DN10019_c0_g1~~TRINITY_DN10019_c0_g1_i1.p1  ORF type:complete len:372 (-),score=45.76 TRINITY_DN10019_c0_g1_i1:147-1262(-)